jgi:transcriptional regulator with XRE-family HTH domain
MTAHVDQRPWVASGRRALTERFGENVRLVRTRINISQETLALRADMHRTEISMLEAGSRMPRLDTFLKLAAGLEVEVPLLLEGIAYRCPPGAAAPGEFEITPLGRLGRRRS